MRFPPLLCENTTKGRDPFAPPDTRRGTGTFGRIVKRLELALAHGEGPTIERVVAVRLGPTGPGQSRDHIWAFGSGWNRPIELASLSLQ
jgi:hypothetical protein